MVILHEQSRNRVSTRRDGQKCPLQLLPICANAISSLVATVDCTEYQSIRKLLRRLFWSACVSPQASEPPEIIHEQVITILAQGNVSNSATAH